MNISKSHLYATVWNKYVPIIRILLKRSVAADQVLALNRIDFERAGSTRKAGYKFTVEFINGKPKSILFASELEQSFTTALQEDEVTKQLLLKNDFIFTFTTKFQLQISNKLKEEPALIEEEMAALD